MLNVMDITNNGQTVWVDYDGPKAAAIRKALRGLDVQVVKHRETACALVTGEIGAAQEQLEKDGYLVQKRGEHDEILAVFIPRPRPPRSRIR